LDAKIKRTGFLATNLLSGWMAIYFSSCQKGCEEVQTQLLTHKDPAQLVEQFNEAMQAWKQGVPFKSGERLSIDSAIWYIDATLNYYYANNNASSARFHWDTVYVEMELVNDYEAMYQQVFASYDESLSGLAEKYHAISGENKRFIMAIVNDAGPLPDNKHKLQIVTVSGTGFFQSSGDFGEDDTFRYEDYAEWDCFGNIINTNAPKTFEAALFQFYNPDPGSNCSWAFYGSTDDIQINYLDHQINNPLTNYLDYKVFAASEAVAAFDESTECLEYNYNSSGIHEMQFYFDYKKAFINEWLNSAQNTENKRFSIAIIGSDYKFDDDGNLYIFHEPVFYFRKRLKTCGVAIEIPPID
jgi:hypothetical protein